VKRGLIIAGLAAILLSFLFVIFGNWHEADPSRLSDRNPAIVLPMDEANAPIQEQAQLEALAESRLTISDLPSNEKPPDPKILKDRPDLQHAFDDNAKPGEFVTPPSVSID
jgi:hypothetical protein